jgi:hypothetical protein
MVSLIILQMTLLLTSCTTRGSYTQVQNPFPSKAEGCGLELFMPDDHIDRRYAILGMYRLEEPLFSVGCNWTAALERYQSEACARGADGIQFVAIDEPEMETTCYRIFGNFIKFE